LIWAGLTVLAAGVATAQSAGWPEMPSHKTYFAPAFFPKNGQSDFVSSGTAPGDIRSRMETFYEGYWRETSYYRANPTNGINERGYFMETKTSGEVEMPWAWNTPSNGVAPAAWTNFNFSRAVGDLANDRIPDGRGEHFDELSDTLTEASLYPIHNASTETSVDVPLADGFWTPGERFTDRGGAALPNGRWDDYVHAEDRWTPVRNTGGIATTILSANLLSFINSSVIVGGITNTKGDFFYDYDTSIFSVSTNDPARVLTYNGLAANDALIWVADISRGVNVPVTISEFDLTPIRYFESLSTTTTITQYAEDRWTPERVLGGIADTVLSSSVRNFLALSTIGDVFADYDYSTPSPSGPSTPVSVLSVNTNLTLWIANSAGGTNVPWNVSELDLTPPVYFTTNTVGAITAHYETGLIPVTADPTRNLEGDAGHTYIPGSPSSAYTNVARLGRFEYERFSGGAPAVYQAPTNLTLEVRTFLPQYAIDLIMAAPHQDVFGFMYVTNVTPRRIVVVNPSAATGLLNNGGFLGFTDPVSPATRVETYVAIPMYYAAPLWGRPAIVPDYDRSSPPAAVLNAFEDAVGADDQWTSQSSLITNTVGAFSPRYDISGIVRSDPVPIMEGDASWTYIRDNYTPPPNLRPLFGNVGFLRRLEYNLDAGGLPHVYQSPRQYDVEIFTYVNLPTAYATFLNNPVNAGVPVDRYVFTNSRVRVLNPPPNFLSTASANESGVANDMPLTSAGMTRMRVVVHVPLYYSMGLWGAPGDAVNYTAAPGGAVGVVNPFLDTVGSDDQPTAAVPAEEFSDFISWWDPVGGLTQTGIWVPGLVGVPTNNLFSAGVLPRGSSPTPYYWSYARYTNYIANNYPGDVAGLIARCGNLRYDSPETWFEAGNNQMIQRGFLSLTSQLSWDFDVAPPHIRSFNDWWANRYGRTSNPTFENRIPFVEAWSPVLDADQESTITTQVVITVSGPTNVLIYGSLTHPPVNSTWTYDSPREFDDLASSLYHNPDLGSRSGMMMRNLSYRKPAPRSNPMGVWDGGDMRLGEETYPRGGSIAGMDRGDNDASTPDPYGMGDGIIPACGPYAYRTHANYGYDAANQLNLEFSTWRTDGQSLTGPRGGHRKTPGYNYHTEIYNGYPSSVMYARDHRDVNLNGLIDQGETIPAGSFNYYQDADPKTIDNGMNTMPLLGWERCVEDMVDTLDMTEDFRAITRFELPAGRGAEEWGIFTPSGYVWREGAAAFATLSNAVGAAVLYADSNGDSAFTPHVDALWVDANADHRFNDLEPIIHGIVSEQEMPRGVGPQAARWADLNGNGVYDINIDLVWMNTVVSGEPPVRFHSEPVLRDASGKLKPGDGNPILTAGLRARDARTGLIRSIYVYPAVTNFTLMWAVTNDYAAATELYYGSSNGVDLIYAAYGASHPALVTTGVLWSATSAYPAGYATGAYPVRYVSRTLSDPGYWPGDDVFIDTNNNGLYDADRFISGPYGLIPLNTSGQIAQASNISVGYTTNGVNTNFQRDTSVAWLEQNWPYNERSREAVLFQTLVLTNGTAGLNLSPWIKWIDLPGTNGVTNGQYDPLVDAVFYDANGDGVFKFGSTARIPLYMAGMANPTGIASPSVFISGQSYGVMTREGFIDGFNQIQSASVNMPNPVSLTQAQSHDVLGWPDLFDYDVYSGGVVSRPVGGGDLMADSGGLMHGYPDLKLTFGVTQQALNYGSSRILTQNGGPRTVLMYPVERVPDQYYVFASPMNPGERFIIHYNAGNLANTFNPNNEQPSTYANPIGRGIVISKSDDGAPEGSPQQQRSNNRFTRLYVQADGKYELEDGLNTVEPADAFGMTSTTRVFTAYTKPAAAWFDGSDSGLRILDIRIPTSPYAPAEVVIDWISVTNAPVASTNWYWVPSGADADGDGIPDAWEYYWCGRSPNPLAMLGRLTDYDGDGLTDYGEWLLHANPIVPSNWANEDTDGDGVSNADELLRGTDPLTAYASATGDKDYTEDWWEDLYDNAAASSRLYDSQRDWDEDGWDNWSESRYEVQSGVPNQPDSGVTAPDPQLSVDIRYSGLSRGQVVVLAYSDRAMNGAPDATFLFAAPTYYPVTIAAAGPVSGRLRQGSNWFFAIMDLNFNRQWDLGEPAALADRFPYDVGWDKNAISFTLSDAPVNGFVRLKLPTVTGSSWYNVEIGRITWSGTNAIFTTVFAKSLQGPRNWLHEGDILDPDARVGGGKPGLDWDGRIVGTPTIPIGGTTGTSIYEVRVNGAAVVVPTNYFGINYLTTTLPTPVAEYPRGHVVSSPRPEFQWTMTPYASAFELQILTTNASPVVVYSSGTNAAPPLRNADGLRVWSPPIHWGDIVPALNGGNGVLTNAAFRWRVRAFQPRLVTGFSDGGFTYSSSISAYSSSETVRINLSDAVTGLGVINVRVAADYLPSNTCIRVQAFETGSLNDLPVVQRTLLNVGALPRIVTLNGLDDQKSYYIAAYVDQITDNARAIWESWGYYRSIDSSLPWHFQPLTVKAAKSSAAPTNTVMIRSVDTDQDAIPDAYEYFVAGGVGGTPVMTLAGGDEGGKASTNDLGWLKVLGLASGSTVEDPVYRDKDGDGINDKNEFDLGLTATVAEELRILDLNGDSLLVWTLTSASDPVGTLATDTLDRPVTYVLERTDSLATPVWLPVETIYGSKTMAGAFDLGTNRSEWPTGFYRVRMVP
jgi:hypothetical protein